MRLLLNAVGYYLTWFMLVYFSNSSDLWIAYTFSSMYIFMHFLLSKHRKRDAVLLMSLVSLGILVDGLLTYFNILHFKSSIEVVGLPVWLIVIWALFSLLPNYSLKWLHSFPKASILFGMIGGPLSYYSAAKLGAVTFPNITLSLIVLSVIWGGLLPFILYKQRFIFSIVSPSLNSPFSTFLIATLFILFTSPSQASPPLTVPTFNISGYEGEWFELARFDNKFQEDCQKNAKANYRLLENGYIEVINSCVEKNGTLKVVKGLARKQNSESPSKYEASFFTVLGWRPVWGDYWILDIDKDYTVAVVGDRNRKFAWIISRNIEITATQKKRAISILNKNGYDTQRLFFSKQDY
ncbi:hypothetical protein DID80_07235 [Candidatus Marinamargulisbacteria bacterium SCGC AAA071-K20]|nr:hypothetical protein DID80_07235 [Candidatus Marinamargulisbacteria bacterium SCGC AAA071-K20]